MKKPNFFHFKKNNQKLDRLLKILKVVLWGDTVAQKITHFYVYLILIGAILLYLPISLEKIPPINAKSKIISEDYFDPIHSPSLFNAKIDGFINLDWIKQLQNNPNRFFKIPNHQNLYLVQDAISRAFKIVEVHDDTFWDAIFTAASAFSDTGLSTVVIRSTYTVFGQVVILLLIQIGGIGFVVIAFLIWKLFRFRARDESAFSKSIMLQAERGNSKLGGTADTIVVAVVFILIVEIIYAIFYSFYFNFVPAYEQQTLAASSQANDPLTFLASQITVNSTVPIFVNHSPYAIWAGIFNSISAMNNAGFDILGSGSLSAYRNDIHALFLIIVASEFFIGGIGYPVIFEIYEHIKHKKTMPENPVKLRYSIFAKLTLISSLIITTVGFILINSIELTARNGSVAIIRTIAEAARENKLSLINNFNANTDQLTHAIYGNHPLFNQVWNNLFISFSTRSAGYSTIANDLYTDQTKTVILVMMFIGASPSSTAGGIRTTTLAVMLIAIWSKLRGYKTVRIFKRTIPKNTVNDAFIITIMMAIWLLISALIASLSIDAQKPDAHLSFIDVLYEFSSAFGTVGLSTGAAALVTSIVPTTLIMMMILMIVGQLGVSTTILAAIRKNPRGNTFVYPYEDIKIG